METSRHTSLTKNTYKNPSPLKTNTKQAKGDKEFDRDNMESGRSSHPPKNKMSIGVTQTMTGIATGGHPEHRASEFSGKGKGYHTDCGDM